MPLTDFSPYLENGVLDLNKAGNKFSCGKGKSESEKGEIRYFKNIFDIKQLVEFIKNTDNIITEFKAAMWGIGEMDMDNFRSLMNAINESKITDLNFENNTLSPEMVDEISKLTKITNLNLGFSNIGNDGIRKIVNSLNLEVLDLRGNYLTDEVVDAIVERLPNLNIFKIGYGNDISCGKLKEIATAHSNTLTEFHIYSSAYSKLEMLDVVTLLPALVLLKQV